MLSRKGQVAGRHFRLFGGDVRVGHLAASVAPTADKGGGVLADTDLLIGRAVTVAVGAGGLVVRHGPSLSPAHTPVKSRRKVRGAEHKSAPAVVAGALGAAVS